MHRLFFALPLQNALKHMILKSFREKSFHGIRFTPEENLHITLHFLGATASVELNEVITKAGTICESASPFEITFEGLKVIQRNRKPVMVWAQFSNSPEFEDLTLQFRKHLPTDEVRHPNPHATVARIKQLKLLPFDLPSIPKRSMNVMSLELLESVTHPEGAKYSVIQTWNL